MPTSHSTRSGRNMPLATPLDRQLFSPFRLIMNGSDASHTRGILSTPCRAVIASDCSIPLQPGAKCPSYVHVFLTGSQEDRMHAGAVCTMQDDTIVRMVGRIRFRRVPRILMDRFFPPADGNKAKAAPTSLRMPPSLSAAWIRSRPSYCRRNFVFNRISK